MKINFIQFVQFQGRILGITIGCIIGMTPLLFMDGDKKSKDSEEGKEAAEGVIANVVVN